MERSNISLSVEITTPDGELAAQQTNTWNNLKYEQVLFIEGYLLKALSDMNEEAKRLTVSVAEVTAKQQTTEYKPGDIR